MGVRFAPPVKSKPKRLKLSRRTVWLRKHRIPTFQIAQIKTLKEVRWEAVKQAMARNQGNILATARELMVNPKTVRAILKQNRRKKPLLQIVGLFVAMCLCGCVTKHVVGYTPIPSQATPPLLTDVQRSSTLSFITAMAAPAPATNAPFVSLAFSPSPSGDVSGYRIHYGPASGNYTNSVDVGTSLTNKLTLPAGVRYYFAALAYTPSGEVSEFSNEVNYYIPKGHRVENLVLEIYETLGGPKVSEMVLHSYTNSIPGVQQKFLKLRQDLIRIE